MRASTSIVVSLLALGAARTAAAAEILHDSFRGDRASVSFHRDTPIDCGGGVAGNDHLEILVAAQEFVQHGDFNNQSVKEVTVLVATLNSCTGESGSGSGVISDPDFRVSAQQTAQVAGSVAVFDATTGALLGNASFDLDFEGIGTLAHNQFHQQLDLGNLTVIQHAVGAFREADVTGTFTFNGVELIDSASGGSIGRSRAGTLLVFRD